MTETTDEQPTVEQSLHSIALSLIEINKVIQEARRTQTRAFRFAKGEAVRIAQPFEPRKKPSLWARWRAAVWA